MERQTDPTDEVLVVRSRAGDPAAFEMLVRRYFGMVYTIGWARFRNAEAAEDLAQEVFLRLHLSLDRLQEPRYFGTWAGRVARNLAGDWVRNSQRRSRLVRFVPLEEDGVEETLSREPTPRERLGEQEELKRLYDAIACLPLQEREVLLLSIVEGMTQQEIGGRLEMHHTTVGRHLKRAVDRLRQNCTADSALAAAAVRPSPQALKRTLAVVTAAAALTGHQRHAFAAAALPGKSPIPAVLSALPAAPPIPSPIPGPLTIAIFKGALMSIRTKVSVGLLCSTAAIATGYHVTHPGEMKQLFLPRPVTAVTKPKPRPLPSKSSFTCPMEPGETIYAGLHHEGGPELYIHLIPRAEGMAAAFSMPEAQIAKYPMTVSGGNGTNLKLTSLGQFNLDLQQSGDALRGYSLPVTSAKTRQNQKQSSAAIELRRIDKSPSIARDMPTAVPLAETAVNDLLGKYAFTAKMAITVTQKNGQLYAQASGQEPLPIYPQSPDSCFYRVIPVELVFGRDAQGKVTRLLQKQNGLIVPARKVQ